MEQWFLEKLFVGLIDTWTFLINQSLQIWTSKTLTVYLIRLI